jgi:hypothetical protein
MSDNDENRYLRRAARFALKGVDVTLATDETEEPNVHSIAAARTRRATAQMMRGRCWPAQPAS